MLYYADSARIEVAPTVVLKQPEITLEDNSLMQLEIRPVSRSIRKASLAVLALLLFLADGPRLVAQSVALTNSQPQSGFNIEAATRRGICADTGFVADSDEE